MKKIYTLPIISVFVVCFAKGQKPVANFYASQDTVCGNGCISFSDSGTNQPTGWYWSFQGATPSSSTNKNPQGICYFNVGNFNVELVVSNSSGSDTLI